MAKEGQVVSMVTRTERKEVERTPRNNEQVELLGVIVYHQKPKALVAWLESLEDQGFFKDGANLAAKAQIVCTIFQLDELVPMSFAARRAPKSQER